MNGLDGRSLASIHAVVACITRNLEQNPLVGHDMFPDKIHQWERAQGGYITLSSEPASLATPER